MAKKKIDINVKPIEKKEYKIGDTIEIIWEVKYLPKVPPSKIIAEIIFYSNKEILKKEELTKVEIKKNKYAWKIPELENDIIDIEVITITPKRIKVFSEQISIINNSQKEIHQAIYNKEESPNLSATDINLQIAEKEAPQLKINEENTSPDKHNENKSEKVINNSEKITDNTKTNEDIKEISNSYNKEQSQIENALPDKTSEDNFNGTILEEKITNLEEKNKMLEEKNEILEKENAKFSKLKIELEEDINKKAKEIEALKAIIETKEIEKNNEKNKNTEFQKQLNSINSQINIFKKEINELKDINKNLIELNGELENRIAKKNIELESLQLDASRKNKTIEEQRGKIRSLYDVRYRLEAKILELEKEAKECEEDFNLIKKDLEEYDNELYKYNEDYSLKSLQLFIRELIKTKKENEKLKTLNKELQKYEAVKNEYDGRYKEKVEELTKKLLQTQMELENGLRDEKIIELYKEAKNVFNEKIIEARNVVSSIKEEQKKLNEAYQDSDMIWKTAISPIIKVMEKESSEREQYLNLKEYPGDNEFIKSIKKIAKRKELHFTDDIYRGMIAAMRASKLIIIKGLSGTGKSTFPKLLGHAFGDKTYVAEVQSNWRTKQDLLGFFNHFSKKFMPTDFTKHLIKFGLPTILGENDFPINFILLDEMNLSKVEWYFADFLSAMFTTPPKLEFTLYDEELNEGKEYDIEKKNINEYYLKEYALRGKFPIPENLWFFGSINEDESTQTISSKVYDRAQIFDFQEIDNKYITNEKSDFDDIDEKYSYKSFIKKSKEIEQAYKSNKQYSEFFAELTEILKEYFGIVPTFRDKEQMRKFFATYQYNGWNLGEAVDLQLSGKILPKIEFLMIENKIEMLNAFYEYSKELPKKLGTENTLPNESRSHLFKGIERISRFSI